MHNVGQGTQVLVWDARHGDTSHRVHSKVEEIENTEEAPCLGQSLVLGWSYRMNVSY